MSAAAILRDMVLRIVVFFLAVLGIASPAVAQAIAAHVSFGYQSGLPSDVLESLPFIGPKLTRTQAGIYAGLPHRSISPGLDLRCSGGLRGTNGVQVGPRVAFAVGRYGEYHPYVEALFGPAHAAAFGIQDPPESHGMWSTFAAGLDYQVDNNVDWRPVEFTVGRYTGGTGANIVTLTTGFTFHPSRSPHGRRYNGRR